MDLALSNAKVVLLAVHLASIAQVDALTCLISHNVTVLRNDIALRILLTFLPEEVSPALYVPLLKELDSGVLEKRNECIDASFVQSLTDEEAVKKGRKLKLFPIVWDSPAVDVQGNHVGLFLLKRAYQIGKTPRILGLLYELLPPFFDQFPPLRPWYISQVLPLIRRNFEYYPQSPANITLEQFQDLSETQCVELLLSQTGINADERTLIGRDLRGMIGPWLQSSHHLSWPDEDGCIVCPAFVKVLEWILHQTGKSWPVAIQALVQWNGFDDIETGDFEMHLSVDSNQLRRLKQMYLQAAIGCVYLMPEGKIPALYATYEVFAKVTRILGFSELPTLEQASSNLEILESFQDSSFIVPKLSSYMRSGFLSSSNPLTIPSQTSVHLLQNLCISAFLFGRLGILQSIKNMGDLVFFSDSQGQQTLVTRYVAAIANRVSHNQEADWAKAREELIWLRSWGQEGKGRSVGVFGSVGKEFIECEFLKALLASTRHYNLARFLYEENVPRPLDADVLKRNIVSQALNAYDHATNPNRTRGGLKKCDEIIHAFPLTIGKNSSEMARIEALLKVTHALSEYSLVLKKGEPFTPVILRAHEDPIFILERVLEQNPKSYTKLQDFVDIGTDLVHAGLCCPHSKKLSHQSTPLEREETAFLQRVEWRVISMCVQAALEEDDFETAYSYVVNRLSTVTSPEIAGTKDSYAWRAALQSGNYIRTPRTVRPTHVGTASVNPDIRHLEQRIECLSTALRIAPASQLEEILQVFSQCEEQLNTSLNAEAASEAAWEASGDTSAIPGSFVPPPHLDLRRTDSIRSNRSTRSTGGNSGHVEGKKPEESMSLFDLSKATARLATRNFTALSGFTAGTNSPARSMSPSMANEGATGYEDARNDDAHRTRKRDQLRDAAVGTLVSGVGWLINAPASQQKEDGETR
ncbi:hypothetical protein Cpir12675_001697 [Ceratocystis pirilliformis]|uniref:Sec39 domain-containing protein n=1 Tax=Ceratocystis pirilliformis TaxID=259994 RepID=A0ABR3ZEZ1_9PEZI